MACYWGQLLAPAEGFDLPPWLFFALRPSRRAYYVVLTKCLQFLCSIGTLITFNSNLNNLEEKKVQKSNFSLIKKSNIKQKS